VPGLATAVAVASVASPLTALGSCVCEGFVSKSFFFLLLPLLSLTMHTPVFQALGLLNYTIDEDVSVKDEATVVCRD